MTLHRASVAVATIALPLALAMAAPRAKAGPQVLLAAAPTVGQSTVNGHPLTAAPVPSIGPGQALPADRALRPDEQSVAAGPRAATPFSSTPADALSDRGSQTDQPDRPFSPSNTTDPVPNLGK